MILLDTNVISELMRPKPSPQVRIWVRHQAARVLFLSAVTEAELRTGAAMLPDGKRRQRLLIEIDAMIVEDFAGRVLPFDSAAAKAYAEIAASRRAAGRPVHQADCQIAAIARSSGADIATRNVEDFQGCGIGIVNPWMTV
ncbi:MAG: PIN domain-containing protein [Alphaproteobacteria bacterium]|jgi:predicted nucleic acid-binding protein|nr:PIN domain-containing protein [Alphaproteobacteria bacterium]